MYINQIDDLFDNLINHLYNFLFDKNFFKKINKDTNFVKFQNYILENINEFINSIVKKEIINIKLKNSEENYIINIIKRYCAFYIYLGISYNYKGGRDLFITNIIESSKNTSSISIENFYNSDNNSKIINFYSDIHNIKYLFEFKTMDKIKIILSNNPIKFNSTINLFNDLGEDYIINYFLINENFHNIIKTLIFRQIYLKDDKKQINDFLNNIEESNGEYKFIEIIVSNNKKLVDFTIIQKFLSYEQLKKGLAEEIYGYLEDNIQTSEIIIKETKDYINFLFSNKILIPISEEFLRFHKDNEKYDTPNNKDTTKIKYIVNKINSVKNYYSSLVQKNDNMKLEINNLFYKHMDPKKVILFNDDEELKIIQKLESFNNASDYDLLIELENIRKYSYINFKNVSSDYIKLRTTKTIDSIRNINLKQKKNESIETRVCHDNLDLNVVGIAWNPSRFNLNLNLKTTIPLECFKVRDMVDVRKYGNNGYKSFLRVFEKTISLDKVKRNLYYWLFDIKKDIFKSNTYIDFSSTDTQKDLLLMLENFYNIYIDKVRDKFNNYVKNEKNINLWKLEKIINIYKQKYFDFTLNPTILNDLLYTTIISKIKELEIIEDEVDNIIPGKRDKLIILPSIKIKDNKKHVIILNEGKKILELNTDENKNIPICNHYIKWNELNKLSKINKLDEDFNQYVFNFVKKYVKQNDRGDYLCKSCNEVLSLKKFVYEGTYVAELDTFLTTSLAVNQKLEELPKYRNYLRTIKNLEKNLEKIAYITELSYYLGNTAIIKLHRKTIIKDVIDLILIHTNYLRSQPKDRNEQYNKKYNINKDLTNLFFFELKDDIFLTSSIDTDYYKIVKFNNVIAYLVFIIITELNAGQILNLRDDKKCNYFFYSKIGEPLFSGLFIRLNQKEKIQLNKIPLLAYCIYYFSCILVENKIWLWNNNNNKLENINIQKSIIHTIVDLINSLIEANLEKDKNYLYELLTTRFNVKINSTFNDTILIKRINDKINKKILFNEQTKKVSLIKIKLDMINIEPNNDEYFYDTNKEYCNVIVKKIKKTKLNKLNNTINALTNCLDGKFHKWVLNNNNMICSLCNEKYNELIKHVQSDNTNTQTEENTNYLEIMKLSFIKKLTKKYCISGNLHQLDNTNVCTLCKINPDNYKYSNKELNILNKNLENKQNDEIIEQINNIKKNTKINTDNKKNIKEIINNFNDKFNTDIKKNFENYIIDFINRLIKILGPKIKIKNTLIYLNDTQYIINHDYLGNILTENIYILESNDIIKIIRNHTYFKKDIIYYKDKSNNVYVYYDIISLQYLGYSEDNKTIKKNKNNVSLIKELSIKDSLLLLGLENEYYNIFHLNSNYDNNNQDDNIYIINSLIRNRVLNIKQLIGNIIKILYNIKFHGKNNNLYNINEKEIIIEFTKKLYNFKMINCFDEYNIFKNNLNINIFKSNIDINLINNNYFNCTFINKMFNTDIKLIYYLIHNFNKILDINNEPAIETVIAYLIIKLIQYSLNFYYKSYNNSEIRKFDLLLIKEAPIIDDSVRLTDNQEIDDEKIKEENYTANEEMNALDIDDYDKDDDIDETMEALDGDFQD